LFPLNVLRTEKPEYIKALEKADNNAPNDLVKFFSKIQRRNIEAALNIQTKPDTLKEAAKIFKEKVEVLSNRQKAIREKLINSNRASLTKNIYAIIENIQEELFEVIPKDKAYIKAIASKSDNHHYYTKQIIEYANEHNYFFNKNMERRWFRISFHVSKVSLEKELSENTKQNIEDYLKDVIKVGMSIITNEIM